MVPDANGSLALDPTPSMLLPAPDSPRGLLGNEHEHMLRTSGPRPEAVANGDHGGSPRGAEQAAADREEQMDGAEQWLQQPSCGIRTLRSAQVKPARTQRVLICFAGVHFDLSHPLII